MASVVSTSGLHFAYRDIVALSGVDLEIPEGSIGLVGANGAGKTTLLKLLLGILSPGAGSVEVLGHALPDGVLDIRSRVGYMPEGPCLPPDQTASDFLIYAAELGGLPLRAARQRASDVLTIVGLHEERFRTLGGFSTGMQQRAKLAQAIVHDPELVLLDEPTAGLDPVAAHELRTLVERSVRRNRAACVWATQDLHALPHELERIVLLRDGRVLFDGSTAEGLSKPWLLRAGLAVSQGEENAC